MAAGRAKARRSTCVPARRPAGCAARPRPASAAAAPRQQHRGHPAPRRRSSPRRPRRCRRRPPRAAACRCLSPWPLPTRTGPAAAAGAVGRRTPCGQQANQQGQRSPRCAEGPQEAATPGRPTSQHAPLRRLEQGTSTSAPAAACRRRGRRAQPATAPAPAAPPAPPGRPGAPAAAPPARPRGQRPRLGYARTRARRCSAAQQQAACRVPAAAAGPRRAARRRVLLPSRCVGVRGRKVQPLRRARLHSQRVKTGRGRVSTATTPPRPRLPSPPPNSCARRERRCAVFWHGLPSPFPASPDANPHGSPGTHLLPGALAHGRQAQAAAQPVDQHAQLGAQAPQHLRRQRRRQLARVAVCGGSHAPRARLGRRPTAHGVAHMSAPCAGPSLPLMPVVSTPHATPHRCGPPHQWRCARRRAPPPLLCRRPSPTHPSRGRSPMALCTPARAAAPWSPSPPTWSSRAAASSSSSAATSRSALALSPYLRSHGARPRTQQGDLAPRWCTARLGWAARS